METHTLARYISESTLQDYSFVTERPSYIAAGSMYLALQIKQLGPWVRGRLCIGEGSIEEGEGIGGHGADTTGCRHDSVLLGCVFLQTPTLLHYSGYTVAEMMPLVKRLNSLLQTPLGQTATVRSKYSHE